MKQSLKISPRPMILFLIITPAVPAARGMTAHVNGLTVFTDTLTVVSLVLIVCGILYSFALKGDFGMSGFSVKMGMKGRDPDKDNVDFTRYEAECREVRERSFNYPLFSGTVYLIASALLAFVVI